MANLVVRDINSNYATWEIINLQNPWNQSYYSRATISTSPVSSGSPNPPIGIMGSGSPSPTGTSHQTGGRPLTGLSPNTTYVLYGSMQAQNGLYYPAGSAVFTTPSARPPNFQWQYSQTVNQAFVPGTDANHAIHRDDWNLLGIRINQFRVYKGLQPRTFTSAYYNMTVTASVFNEMRNAIVGMIPPNPPTSEKSSGVIINASDISGLRYALNSIT